VKSPVNNSYQRFADLAISFNRRIDFSSSNKSRGDAMRYLPVFCLFAVLNGFTAPAQVLPTSSGSCTVAASGTMGCNWMSGLGRRQYASPRKTTDLPDDYRSALFVTQFRLAPGASLDSQTIVGGEVLIVGRNDGEVINEKKSPPNNINISDGSVMLMQSEEPYLLRNIGKANLELLVIEIRK